MKRRSGFLVAAVLLTACQIDPPPAVEVDALDRAAVDISADGVYALTRESTMGWATKRINLVTGAEQTIPDGALHARLYDDGSAMVFDSVQSFVPADTDSDLDIYRYTFGSGAYSLVELAGAPAGWTFSFQDISGDGRYLGLYGTNGVWADSGVFVLDTVTSTWRQPDSLMADFELGVIRQSSEIRLSSDGRHAAWTTFAAAGCLSCSEVWVYDWQTNTAENATVRFDDGDLTDGNARDGEISSDGRHVVFTSNASNLVEGFVTAVERVYVRHLDTDVTVMVTEFVPANTPAGYTGPSIGGAGTRVMVMEDVDGTINGNYALLPQPVLYDLGLDAWATLTDPPGSDMPNGFSNDALISGNGQRALFSTTADNFATVTPSVPPGQLVSRVFSTALVEALPARLLDTRPSGVTDDGLFQGQGALTAGTELALDVGGRRTIPLNAEAVVLNLTAVQPAGGGFVTAYPCGTIRPNASSLNLLVGRAVANITVAQLGTSGQVCLYSSANTHLIVDATFVFEGGSQLNPVQPQRLLDTRSTGETIDGLFEASGIVAAGGDVQLQLSGRGDIPANAAAVVLNVTSTTSGANGNVLAYPCDVAAPTASIANYQAGLPKASLTVVALSATGEVCLRTSAASHLIADAVGYFDDTSTYTPLTPARLLDTRPIGATIDDQFEASGIRAAGSTLELTVSDRGGVPVGEQTVLINVAAVAATGTGFVTAYTCGALPPTASTANLLPAGAVNNHAVVTTSAAGTVCLYVSNSTHLIVDVEGVLP